MNSSVDEFDFIAKYFKPLAAGFSGSLNLSDDAAILTPKTGEELVITKDALSQGVHFIGSEDPALIAGKALRVNLSDLAAMGATPLCYFLALILPKNTDEQWLEKFANGLKQTQDEFAIALAGGDTTATNGTLSISVTAIGSVPIGKALRRSGAKIGDNIYVSGTIGDAAAGLELCKDPSTALRFAQDEKNEFLINHYLIPKPHISLGIALRDIANSAMDISDGLVQDLGHICTASNVGAMVYADKIPATSDQPLIISITGGDDYELLFTASPDKKSEIENLASNQQITCIGKITAGDNVVVLDETGAEIKIDKKGYSHF